MKPKGRVLVLVCALAALLALPAGASAKAQGEIRPGRYLLSIGLPSSDGWEVSILAFDHHHVYLRAQRGFAAVTYRAPGRVSSERVEADFGGLGRIDLNLDLEARGTGVPRLHGRCTGKSPYELTGSFHGTVDFPGEPNIFSVSAHRGKAKITRTFQHVCRPNILHPRKFPPGLEVTLLGARSHENGRTVSFEAVGLNLESLFFLGVVSGSVHERLGQVGIARARAYLVSEDEMHVSKPGSEPERIQVKPPSPFLGRASYLKAAGEPPRWSGDLRVSVPGGGLIALAGPNFNASLCRPHSVSEITGCKPRFQELKAATTPQALLDLYGSGSHSQPLALARLSSLR